MARIYWAAPLFSMAERTFNRRCAENLRAKGHTVILPQDEAERFMTPQGMDFDALSSYCMEQATEHDFTIGILDGADVDSGTAFEMGVAAQCRRVNHEPVVVGVRTDFRSSEDKHVNAMFRQCDEFVYFPFSENVQALCNKIQEALLPHLK